MISEDGYIVTNNHVIDKADEITVTIGKDQEYKAKVVGADPKTDVALIKIKPKNKLTTLVLGNSDDLQVGEIVVAIGNPFGFSHTVTQGIVSGKQRAIDLQDFMIGGIGMYVQDITIESPGSDRRGDGIWTDTTDAVILVVYGEHE